MIELDTITLRQAIKGNKTAFRMLYDHYAPFLWKVIYKTVKGQEALAEDVMQETFIRVHRSLKSFLGGAAFSTWLYRIAFNTALSWINKIKPYSPVDGPGDRDYTELSAQRFEARDLLKQLVDGLEAKDRFLLISREVTGLTYEELALIDGSSAGALRIRLHRIKADLQQQAKQLLALPL